MSTPIGTEKDEAFPPASSQCQTNPRGAQLTAEPTRTCAPLENNSTNNGMPLVGDGPANLSISASPTATTVVFRAEHDDSADETPIENDVTIVLTRPAVEAAATTSKP